VNEVIVFVQTEGQDAPFDLKLSEAATWRELTDTVRKTAGNIAPSSVVLLEDRDDEVPEEVLVGALKGNDGTVRVHVHRCHQIAVTVDYSGRPTLQRSFAPSTTVAKVKAWAGHQLGIGPADLAELVLEVAGTNTRPDADTHIGTLVAAGQCSVAFNLVFVKRVQG